MMLRDTSELIPPLMTTGTGEPAPDATRELTSEESEESA
eukprot:CAMPEP_0119140458 /NCGR_PEP_ID=MMETSP1310-20130426/29248_1 /TAXON_ID=464262 /ORGANISM="Genus nov. species nov., Strain RCC2339" /LENGTH=38 /DNA_ID= /DNA_START= /DNA_END= /DNA_ORIENTATION=